MTQKLIKLFLVVIMLVILNGVVNAVVDDSVEYVEVKSSTIGICYYNDGTDACDSIDWDCEKLERLVHGRWIDSPFDCEDICPEIVSQTRAVCRVKADETAPVMTELKINNITGGSAIIKWETDEFSDSFVKYWTINFEIIPQQYIKLKDSTTSPCSYETGDDACASINRSCENLRAFYHGAWHDCPDSCDILCSDFGGGGESGAVCSAENITTIISDSLQSEEYVTEHSVEIFGLSTSTDYYYEACSTDASDNFVCSDNMTFTTLDCTSYTNQDGCVDAECKWSGEDYKCSADCHSGWSDVNNDGVCIIPLIPDTIPPFISGLKVESITENHVVIKWETNELSDSAVYYGIISGDNIMKINSEYVTEHQIEIQGLLNFTNYFYSVCSSDFSGNRMCSGERIFTTSLVPPLDCTSYINQDGCVDAECKWSGEDYKCSADCHSGWSDVNNDGVCLKIKKSSSSSGSGGGVITQTDITKLLKTGGQGIVGLGFTEDEKTTSPGITGAVINFMSGGSVALAFGFLIIVLGLGIIILKRKR